MAQQFQVEEVPDNVVPHPSSGMGPQAAIAGILLGLKALSQGAAIALGHIANQVFALVTVSMVFWIWASIPDPNQYQIVSLALFGLFVLAANSIVRRK